MRFDLSAEQRDFQQAIRHLIDSEAASDQLVTTIGDDQRDQRLWQRLLNDIGVGDILREGTELMVEAATAAREIGRGLVCPDFLPASVAAAFLRHDTENHGLLDDVQAGRRSIVVVDPGATGDSGLTVSTRDTTDVLSGTVVGLATAAPVPCSAIATAATDDGVQVFVVDDCPEPKVADQRLDLTRTICTLDLGGASARRVSLPPLALEAAYLIQAAEAIGAGETCLELAVDHAKVRHQFGHPIGSFQAIKHRCATVATRLEAARAAMWNAAWELSVQTPTAGTRARIAKAASIETLKHAAENLIQILGGTGFTWEHPAHLYYRRAVASQHLFGTIDEHRDLVAQRLFVPTR